MTLMARSTFGVALALFIACQPGCTVDVFMDVKATMRLPEGIKADCYLEQLPGDKDVVLDSKKLHPPDNPFTRSFHASIVPSSYRARVRCDGLKPVYTSQVCTAGMVSRCHEIDMGVLTFTKE